MTGHTVRGSRALFVLGCLVVAFAVATAGTGSAQSGNKTTLAVADATVEQDEEAQVRVSLDRVPAGLSGYEVTLRLRSAGVATVTGASYPGGYQPTTEPEIGADGRMITIEAADISGEVEPGATNVTLATVNVSGVDSGTTTLVVTDLQVDADDGSRVDPALDAGTVTVGTGGESGSTTTPTTSPESEETSATDSGPSPTANATTEPAGESGPGFGLLAALCGLCGLCGFAALGLRG